MKRILILLLLTSVGASAQSGKMDGIDAYFMEEGYFDNLTDALGNPDSTFYLDLSLQSPKLKEVPAEVYQFKNLMYLELGYNQIGAVSDEIFELTSLEVLGLDGNKYLTTVSSKVSEIKSLKEIHLKDTGLSDTQLDNLKKKLPAGCKVLR